MFFKERKMKRESKRSGEEEKTKISGDCFMDSNRDNQVIEYELTFDLIIYFVRMDLEDLSTVIPKHFTTWDT